MVYTQWAHCSVTTCERGTPIIVPIFPYPSCSSRLTFRNLALRAGASEFHVNLVNHPKKQKAADFYTRLEMQWEGMCRAVLAIDPTAWAGQCAL